MGIYEIKKPRKINSFSVTLFLIVTIGGYLLYWYIPIWWPIFQMQGIMNGICNDAYREIDNEKLMAKLLKESQRTHLRVTKENFKLERVPYMPNELPNLTEYAAARGKFCKLSFSYAAESELPFIGKRVQHEWHKSAEVDLKIVKY